MKAKTAFQEAKTWQRKCRIIYIFHLKCITKNRKWTFRDSSLYFGISLGNVSEAILLIRHYELVKVIKSRNKALKLIRGKYGHPFDDQTIKKCS